MSHGPETIAWVSHTHPSNLFPKPIGVCDHVGLILKTVRFSGLMNAEEIIRSIEAEHIKDNIPKIYVGDTIRIGVRIVEGGKERVQPFEGTVIAMRNGGINETITVRRVFQGVGVERVFLLHAPRVANIKVIRRGKARRAKLYYLRDRVGKATRLKQRFDRPIEK